MDTLAICICLLPLLSFLSCAVIAVIWHFDSTTRTHCKVDCYPTNDNAGTQTVQEKSMHTILKLLLIWLCRLFLLQTQLVLWTRNLYSLCFVWVHHGGVKHSFSLALYVDILRSKAYFWLLWRPFAEEELSTHSYLAYLFALLHDVCSLVWWRVCDGLIPPVLFSCSRFLNPRGADYLGAWTRLHRHRHIIIIIISVFLCLFFLTQFGGGSYCLINFVTQLLSLSLFVFHW